MKVKIVSTENERCKKWVGKIGTAKKHSKFWFRVDFGNDYDFFHEDELEME